MRAKLCEKGAESTDIIDVFRSFFLTTFDHVMTTQAPRTPQKSQTMHDMECTECTTRIRRIQCTVIHKTEMIFPLLQHTLDHGGRALVATPRRDVVLELAPRLAKAFPDTSLATLYGGSDERWKDAQLTLATTHQLMRFYQGFDLVIIDELDAFPYHNDPMLAHAASSSCKPGGISSICLLHRQLGYRERRKVNSLMPKSRYVSTVILCPCQD